MKFLLTLKKYSNELVACLAIAAATLGILGGHPIRAISEALVAIFFIYRAYVNV